MHLTFSYSDNGEIDIKNVGIVVIHNPFDNFVSFHGAATFEGLQCQIEMSLDSVNGLVIDIFIVVYSNTIILFDRT